MRNMRCRVLPPAIVVLLFSCCVALAQTARRAPEFRQWEFSVFGGGSFLGDQSYQTPVVGSSTQTSRTVGVHYATGSHFGIRVAENRGQHWAASFEYSYSNQPITFTGLSDSLPSFSPGHGIHRGGYDILYYAADRAHRLRPYVLAGVGMTLYDLHHNSAPDGSFRLSDPWKVGFNWGGGVKYILMDHIGVSAQYNNWITSSPGYGLPSTASAGGTTFVPGMNSSGLYSNSLLSVGLIYTWDRR